MLTNDQIAKIVVDRLDKQDETLAKIEGAVTRTNGRVTQLEQDRAVREALQLRDREEIAQALKRRDRWSKPLFAIVVAGVGSAAGSFAYLLAHGV